MAAIPAPVSPQPAMGPDRLIKADVVTQRALEPLRAQLEASSGDVLRLQVGDATVALPEPVRRALRRVVRDLSRGHAVTLVTHRSLLTPQQAADLLGVSRPYLMGLVEKGVFGTAKVGSHHRLSLEAVLAYRDRRDAAFDVGMDELTRGAEASGGYLE